MISQLLISPGKHFTVSLLSCRLWEQHSLGNGSGSHPCTALWPFPNSPKYCCYKKKCKLGTRKGYSTTSKESQKEESIRHPTSQILCIIGGANHNAIKAEPSCGSPSQCSPRCSGKAEQHPTCNTWSDSRSLFLRSNLNTIVQNTNLVFMGKKIIYICVITVNLSALRKQIICGLFSFILVFLCIVLILTANITLFSFSD